MAFTAKTSIFDYQVDRNEHMQAVSVWLSETVDGRLESLVSKKMNQERRRVSHSISVNRKPAPTKRLHTATL